MCYLQKLWRDDAGFVLSSELVLVGTLGVVGATVGLNALATSINAELSDVAYAFRSLDQSYEVAEVRGHGAWTAGSSFRQQPVEESLRELSEQIDRDEQAVRQRQAEQARRSSAEQKATAPEDQPKAKRAEQKAAAAKQPAKEQPKPKKKPKGKDRDDEEVIL